MSLEALHCTCGRTTIEPPVPCGAPIPTCSHLCSIARPCGHPQAAWHTCHVGPCPPCTHSTDRPCAGGHEIKHIPCHIQEVVCTRKCGKLLPCGTHTCEKVCHYGPCVSEDILAAAAHAHQELEKSAAVYASTILESAKGARIRTSSAQGSDASSTAAPTGEIDGKRVYDRAFSDFMHQNASRAQVACNNICNHPRDLCPHTCQVACHPGKPCPAIPCNQSLTVYCACNRLCAAIPCLHGAASAESDMEQDLNARSVPCDDMCLSAERARAFASGAGVSVGDARGAAIPFPDALVAYARENGAAADKIERQLRAFLAAGTGRPHSIDLPCMMGAARGFVHQLAEVYGLHSESFGVDPKRYVRIRCYTAADGTVRKDGMSSIGTEVAPGIIVMPSMTLLEAAAYVEKKEKARANNFVKVFPPAATAVHPLEPHVSSMDQGAIGRTLHLLNIRRSTKETDLRDCLGCGGACAFRRLDDHNMLATFETQGRAARALENVHSAEARGSVLPCKARYWGVGVEAFLASKDMHSPSIPPAPSASRQTAGASAWATIVSSKGATAHASMSAAGTIGAPIVASPPAAPVFNRFAAAFNDTPTPAPAPADSNTWVRGTRRATARALGEDDGAW
jgi:hypothetical protein